MVGIPDSHRDLYDSPGVASLSTVGKDGRPQVTATWFLAEGDTVATSLVTGRQKYKNVLAHPTATLFIIDPANPFRTLEVRADVAIETDPDLALLDRLLRHYGQEDFPADRENRAVLRLTPTHVVAKG